ncbi:MAG: ComEC family competence protein [Candidatus Pacebacteria bacterium]|jgi:competence protein ComEC|nr:ComEC family competence protein [Candidatus Paceibacterota bacterium]
MQPKYFFGFIISFIVGVAFENIFRFGYSAGFLFVFLSAILLPKLWRGSHVKHGFFVSLLLLGCGTGILRVDVSQAHTDAHVLDRFTEKMVTVSGIVLDEPDVRENYTNIVLETHNVLYDETKINLDTKPRILVRVPVFPEILYGDEVTMIGKITLPKNFAPEENQKAFDYRSYLAKDNIYYQMFFPSINVVSHDKGNIVIQKLFALKAWLMGNIAQKIPEPESSLAGGITLGAKQSLGEELLQKFRETGVAHIVVLSGYNIAVVAGIISWLVMFLPFSLRLVVSALGIILFALMVGGGATVVRATIMALIIILARVLGREGDALRALVLAGGVMVFANPMILLYDVSFQLSFSATLALVTLVPVLEKYFTIIPSRIFREIVITTFATQIFVLPLILYHMGSVSLIGLISNIFILPVVPFAMLAVALVAGFAWVPLVGSVVAFVAYGVLAYIFLAVDFFARIPFAALQGISFPLWALAIAYVLLGYYIVKNFPKKVFVPDDSDF